MILLYFVRAVTKIQFHHTALKNIVPERVFPTIRSAQQIRTIRNRRMGDIPGPVQSAATVKLKQTLKPVHMDVINESYMHNVPKGTESHFKVIVVSEQFVGKPLIQRHRMVNEVLHEELDTGAIHALSIVAKTPEQWAKSQEVGASPKCMGGSQN